MNILKRFIFILGINQSGLFGLLFSVAILMVVFISPQSAKANTPEAAGIDYDIIYVRYPRRGDTDPVELPDAENPYSIEPGADLMLLHPDGSEEVLVDCRVEALEVTDGGEKNCSVQDPVISFDGKWVYYSKYVSMGLIDRADLRSAWRKLTAHSFLFKIALDVPAEDREEIQLTNLGDGFAISKLSGNSAVDAVSEFGIRDLGPTPLPDGRLLFTSNREAIVAYRQGVKNSVSRVSASTVSQVYIMDDHFGSTPNKNLHLVGHSALHQVQHPMVLKDGRILFTNWDDAGLREEYATATLYVDQPDGGRLEQFLEPHHYKKRVEHFATELSSGNVVVSSYYPKMASWGYGTLLRVPVEIDGPKFLEGLTTDPESEWRYFSRKGTEELTPHTVSSHSGPADLSGRYSTPSVAPDDGMLVSYSSGPVSFNPPCDCVEFPRLDAGLYLIKNAGTNSITDPASQLFLLKNDASYNEMWPRAVIPYQKAHGIAAPSLSRPIGEYEPSQRSHANGSPTGLTGTSSMQNRESAPLGRDRFNSTHTKDGGGDKGWVIQGTDAGLVTNDDLWGVRILVMTPDRYHKPWITSAIEKNEGLLRDTRFSQHIKGYYTHTAENWKILGEFPVRNSGGLADPDGEEDTSWLAKIPADTPHLIQSIDRYGMTLSTEQTWRHVRAGETFAPCGGCHGHSLEGIPFAGKWADKPSYQPWDLINDTPMLVLDDSMDSQLISRSVTGLWGVEFRQNILPILQDKCASCHTSENNTPPASNSRLAMFDSTLSGFDSEVRTFRALALDKTGEFSHGTTIPAGKNSYLFPQKSRYVRAIQARASYLVWKIYDTRLDGRENDDLPGTLSSSYEDLDYVSGNCTSSELLTNDEKGLITRWIDLGAPIDLDRPRIRYTDDHLLPVMTLAIQEVANGEVQLRIGVLDIESGIDFSNSRAEITPDGGGILTIPFSAISFDSITGVGTYILDITTAQVTLSAPLQIFAVVQDNAGNKQTITRTMEEIKLAKGSLQFSVSSIIETEDSGSSQLVVLRSEGDEGVANVDYAVTAGSATAGVDYNLASGTLTWADGESGGKNILLTILDDNNEEGDETITLTLSNPSNGVTLGAQDVMEITIANDDIAGQLEHVNASVTLLEDTGSTELVVNRSNGSDGEVTVNYAVMAGNALLGSDYNLLSGTLTWPHGVMTQGITLLIVDDKVVESDETLTIALSDPTNGAILGGQNTIVITIDDDDIAGTLQYTESSSTVPEDVGTTQLTVERLLGQDGAITVDYSVTAGDAAQGSDYTLSSGTLSWMDAESGSKTIPLLIIDDKVVENDEILTITLSNPTNGAILGTPQDIMITIDDDDIAGTLQYTESSSTVSEDVGTILLTVERLLGLDGAITVDYSVTGGDAVQGSDYTLFAGTLSWMNADSSSKTIQLLIINDTEVEFDETLTITLSNPTNGAILGVQRAITITIDEYNAGMLQYAEDSVTVPEGVGATPLMVERLLGQDGAITVGYSVTAGDAVQGSDYTLSAGTLSWADADSASKAISLLIIDDTEAELDETLTITLSNPTNGAILGVQQTITITIDDDEPVNTNNNEGDDGDSDNILSALFGFIFGNNENKSIDNTGGAGSLSAIFILSLFSLLAIRLRGVRVVT